MTKEVVSATISFMQILRGRYYIAALVAAVILGGVFFAGYKMGKRNGVPEIAKVTTLTNKTEGEPETVDFRPFWKVWNVLNEKFVSSKATTTVASDQEKVFGAIGGLTSSLGDPYTVFFPPVEKKMFEEDISGNFEGVGMEIGVKNKVLIVIAPLKGNPAEAAGVRAGDQILKINDTVTTDMTTEAAVKLIRGKKGTIVRLTLQRESRPNPFELKIIRDTINIPTVDTELRPDGIFVIKLHNFSAISTGLFRDALRQFIEARTDKMIFDLRGNPGGYLEAAVDMASWFLPVGKVIVREDKAKNGPGQIYRSSGYNIFNDNLKMVILVDGGSASASEILAGALSEQGRATLVGEKTFGKGSVQELVSITPDTSLKVTIARWLTPNGISISEAGIKPDYTVKMTEADAAAGRDPQLSKAVALLLQR